MSVDELTCKLECQDLLVRLASALDRGENGEAADLFSEDGVLARPDGVFKGPALREALLKRPSAIVTRHNVSNLIVTPTGSDAAKGSAYITVYRSEQSEAAPRKMPATPAAAGEWHIQFRKTDAGWRISRYDAISALEAR